MRILFLCVGVNPWRSLIAKKVLKSMDDKLDIFAAQLNNKVVFGEKLKAIMSKLGFTDDDLEIHIFRHLLDYEFDYVITLSRETKDSLNKLAGNYKHKLHLEFSSQKDLVSDDVNSIQILQKIQTEFEEELDYFYHRILRKKAAK